MSLNNISNNNTENNNLPDINEKAKQKTGTASFRATAMSVTLLTKSSIIYGLTSGVFFFISLISRPFSGSTSDYYNFKATRVIDKLCSQFLKEKMNRIFGSLFIGTSINRINANKKEFQTISDLIKRNSFPFLKTKEFSPLLKGGTCFGIILDLAKKYIASNEPGAGGMNVFKNQCLSLKKGSSPDAAVYQNIFPSTLGSTKSEPLSKLAKKRSIKLNGLSLFMKCIKEKHRTMLS